MVGVPTALHLAAGLLAVAASAGLGLAILGGALAGDGGERGRPGPARLAGTLGALVYAVGHGLAGAVVGDPQVWTTLHVVGLALLAVGAGPTRSQADRRGEIAAPLLIPAVPATPSYVAAGMAVLVAARMLGAGRQLLPVAGGVLLLGLGHAAAPTQPLAAEWLTVAGALAIGAWLWMATSPRILDRLLTAFVSSLLALAILTSVVLSAVGTAELAEEELSRLSRIADGLVAEVSQWPADAVNSATAISIAPRPLLADQLQPQEAADLYRVGFADQDFFLVLDAAGNRINGHPQDLGGSIELSLTGDALVRQVRDGVTPQQGGLLATAGRIVAFGAVGLRPDGLLPEDPPAGVLITGRLVDAIWAEQEAAQLDVGIIGDVGGSAAFTAGPLPVAAPQVLAALADPQAALEVDGQSVFAAAAPLVDPELGARLGRIVTTSTPDVIASVEAQQTRRLFLVSLAGGLLAMLAVALVTRRFVRPIIELTAAARRIGQGDLSAHAGIDSPDEVGVLGATFDEMVRSLQVQKDELTDAATTEAKLRGRLESLTTSMSDGLIAVDPAGDVIQFNPAAEQLTGLTAAAAMGTSLRALLGGRLGEPVASEPMPGMGSVGDLALDDPLSEERVAARLTVQRPDGAEVPVAATAAPVRSPSGEPLGRVFVLRDISPELQVERMKTEFLANVSHELRTPITPIKGYANVLARRDVGPERTRQFATQILDSTARLERIVGMIVDFAGLDSGRVRPVPEPVELTSLVNATLEDWRNRHEGRVFGNHLNGGLPPVMADPTYLRRVLEELLDNAVKFSPEGDPIDLTAVVDGDELRLGIVDRGVGIDPQSVPYLFTDFRQLDGTETRHFGGLGLGLGLVKRILDATGARAEVESDPGVGSTVTIVLPVGQARPDPTDQPAPRPPDPPPAWPAPLRPTDVPPPPP